MSQTSFSIEDGKALLQTAFAPWVLAQNLTPETLGKTQASYTVKTTKTSPCAVAPALV